MSGLENDNRELDEKFLKETGFSRREMVGLLCMLMSRSNFKRSVARKVRIWESSLLGKELKLVETRTHFGNDFDYVLEAMEWEISFTVHETGKNSYSVPFGTSRGYIECTAFEGSEDQYNTDLTLIRLFNLADYDTASDPDFMDPWLLKEQDIKMIGGFHAIP